MSVYMEMAGDENVDLGEIGLQDVGITILVLILLLVLLLSVTGQI